VRATLEFLDLIVIVPDADMEASIRGLLARPEALKIRPVAFDVARHVQRDAGCRSDCHNYLRLWQRSATYASVLFDHAGSGCEQTPREELELQVEEMLRTNGWDDRCAVIAIAPELETWVWSDSPVVDNVLGWGGQVPGLRDWLRHQTHFWTAGRPKPERPKEAMEAALRKTRKQRSSAIYQDLAGRVSVERCVDPALGKLKDVLHRWFPRQD